MGLGLFGLHDIGYEFVNLCNGERKFTRLSTFRVKTNFILGHAYFLVMKYHFYNFVLNVFAW